LSLGYIPKARLDMSLMPEIDEACRRRHAVFCKWEPDEWQEPGKNLPDAGDGSEERLLARFPGFRASPQNIQPPRTISIDISGSEDEILRRMKQKTRYNIRLAEKKDVSVDTWEDIQAFHEMMLVTGGRDQFAVHSSEYYRRAYELFQPVGMAELFAAKYHDDPLAALMVFRHGSRAWYVYGASNESERNRMPSYLLQWEAMRWAKSHGCLEYDLWGVPDEPEAKLEAQFETRSDGLWGVYRFKRGFGGTLKRAAQALDRIYMPVLYRLYLFALARRG
jgi:lipid II:glycine glycyltransferase (peptidoglycan interpeptide bridge formation enzyme)